VPHTRIRQAIAADIPEIERVIRASLVGISSRTYDESQVKSALIYIAHLDRELVDDGTYFVVEADGGIVACGGWSRRAKLYAGSADKGDEARLLDPATESARVRAMFVDPAFERQGLGRRILLLCEDTARAEGFRKVELMAMLSGEAMYLACGYAPVENVAASLKDGTPFPLTRMEKVL
jgi:GNAT superfamily N-acetyltransferase